MRAHPTALRRLGIMASTPGSRRSAVALRDIPKSVIDVIDLEASVPFPEMPAERDEITVDNEDMELVPAPKRGRPRKVYDQGLLNEVLRLYFVEKMSMRQIANLIGVSHMSVYRMLSDPTVELLL